METRPMDPEGPICPLCGEPVSATATRCENCGAAVSPRTAGALAAGPMITCPDCGEKVSSGASECPTCGRAFEVVEQGELSPDEERLLEELEWAIVGEARAPLPRPEGEVSPEVQAERQSVFDFISQVSGVGRVAAGAVSGFFVTLEHISLSEIEDLAAIPLVSPEEARRIKEAVDAHVAAAEAAPETVAPAPELAPAPPPPADAERPVMTAATPSRARGEPQRARVEPSGRRRIPEPIGRRSPIRSARLRDLTALASGLAVAAVGIAEAATLGGREWGQLFAFSVLFGLATTTTIPDLLPIRGRGLPIGAGGFGIALLGSAPVLELARTTSVESAVVGLTALGLGLLGFASWRLRGGAGLMLPWLAGLLLLALVAIPSIALLPPSASATTLWLLGGILAVTGPALVGRRRWFEYSMNRGLATGDAAFGKRDYPKAVAAYEDAIGFAQRAGVDASAGWYGKGAALIAQGRASAAVEALDRALALNPVNEIAWINKGTALSRLGELKDALRCYNSAIKVNPEYEVAWNNKGNALARLGKYDLALQCYERALTLDEEYRSAWANKGYILAKLGRFEEAAACAEAATRLTAMGAAGA